MEEIGNKYNRLTIIDLALRDKQGRRRYLCKCICGNKCIIDFWKLKNNWSKSCGCLQVEKAKEILKKVNKHNHNLCNSDLYSKWSSIKRRCYNKNVKDYKNYGGRGIKVCNNWIDDFGSFYNWAINNGYKKGLEIDRIDVNGNYEPCNCRFITHKENCNNRRISKKNVDRT